MARICIIRQFYFPLDTRVRREVGALAEVGHEVDVLCMRRPNEPALERDGRVRVIRLPLEHRRGGLARYLFEYGVFFVLAAFVAAALHVRRRYDVVQVNSIPDTLVFAAALPRLLGARVLLDLHECLPEFFATKFGKSLDHPAVRLVARLEQASIRFAHATITCTEQMREAFVSRGAHDKRIDVVLNSADEALFDPDRYPSRDGDESERFVLISHGAIEDRYGLDTLLEATALLKEECPALMVEIYGDGSYRAELRRLATDLGVEDRVRFSDGFVPLDELLQALADADVGVVAMKRDAFRDLTHCNKMFDFIAMRTPAIMSRTRSVEAYFDDSSFQFFRSDDAHDLARAIRELYDDRARGARLARRAAQVAEPYRWARQREVYLAAVRRLLTPGGDAGNAGRAGREAAALGTGAP